MKKFRSLILVLALITFCSDLFSQSTGKKVIAIVPITNTTGRGGNTHAANLTELVISTIVKTRRFKVVDRTNFDAIFSEENLQKGENFIDGEVVAQGKKLGAEYIIAGNLANFSTEKLYTTSSSGGKQFAGYRANISFTLKIINVITGEIIAVEPFNVNSGRSLLIYSKKYNKENEAITAAINNTDKIINLFIDDYFPVYLKIFEISKQKGSKAKEIVITGGSNIGLQEKQDLKIVEVSLVDIGGKTVERKKEIGWVKIISVDDEYFSTCKVTDGDEIIKKKFDSNANIFAISGVDK